MTRLAAALLAALVAAGAASAARIQGTPRADGIVGTGRPDAVASKGGDDRIAVAADNQRDTVDCGPGRDIVVADPTDRIVRCEVVSRQISRDVTTAPAAQHEAQAEPDVESFGQTLVAVFQTGRFFGGGAADIGFARSADGGRTWRSGTLPGVSRFSSPPGAAARASDPVIAYDAVHRTWLASTLLIHGIGTRLGISRSPDGLAWSLPVDAASASFGQLAYDKEWLSCDNGDVSPYRGRCYLAYTDYIANALSVQVSADGGQTWALPVSLPAVFPVVGAFPVVQPDGAVTVLFLHDDGGIAAVRSTDGGATFGGLAAVGPTPPGELGLLRAVPVPGAAVDAAGRIVVAWYSCALRTACAGNDVLVSTSADGTAWTPPVPVRAPGSAFTPAIATSSDGRIGVAFHTVRDAGVNVWLAESRDAIAWAPAQRLSAQSMPLGWLADTNQGRMLGDYIGLAYAGSRPVPVFALAAEPSGDVLRQGIFARVR